MVRTSASFMSITTAIHVLRMLKQVAVDGFALSNRNVLQVLNAESLPIKVGRTDFL